MNDGTVFMKKQFVRIWHTESIFKSAVIMQNVYNIDIWKWNDRESNHWLRRIPSPRPEILIITTMPLWIVKRYSSIILLSYL